MQTACAMHRCKGNSIVLACFMISFTFVIAATSAQKIDGGLVLQAADSHVGQQQLAQQNKSDPAIHGTRNDSMVTESGNGSVSINIRKPLSEEQSSSSSKPKSAPISLLPTHKALLPIEYHDVMLFLLSFLVLSLAAGAGIGGGVLLVPMLSLITGFGPIQTVALSNITILAGAVTNAAFNLPRKNPVRPGPLIDYDLLLLFGPPIVMGSIAGSYINYMIPGWVTKLLVLLVLVPMTFRMMKKARMLWIAETKTGISHMPPLGKLQVTANGSIDGSRSQMHPGKQHAAGHCKHHTHTFSKDAIQHCDTTQAAAAAAAAGASACCTPSLSHEGCAAAANAPPADQLYGTVHQHCTRHELGRSLPLPERQHSLADLLGPYLVLLTTPEAAEAAATMLEHDTHASIRGSSEEGGGNSTAQRHGSCSGGSQLIQGGSINSDTAAAAPAADGLVDLVTDDDSDDSVGVNAAPVISPFQLYQLQHNSKSAQHEEHELRVTQQQAEQLPGHVKAKCALLDHAGCIHSPELLAKMQHKIEHHSVAQVPKAHLCGLVFMLVAVSITSVCGQLLLTCGTWQYWVVVLAPLPLMLVVWGLMRWHVLWRVGWQECLGMAHATDIHWTPTSTLTYPAICITAGLMAGMLGLGGGTVLAPLLLEMRVQPGVGAASSQAAMLMSSCTSTVVYLVNNALPKDYGIAMAAIGLTGTLFGQVVVNYVLRRTGRSSILVFILAGLFVIASGASVIVITNAVMKLVHDPALLSGTHRDEICVFRTARPH